MKVRNIKTWVRKLDLLPYSRECVPCQHFQQVGETSKAVSRIFAEKERLAEKKAQEAAEQAAADPEGTAAAEAAAGDSQGKRGRLPEVDESEDIELLMVSSAFFFEHLRLRLLRSKDRS